VGEGAVRVAAGERGSRGAEEMSVAVAVVVGTAVGVVETVEVEWDSIESGVIAVEKSVAKTPSTIVTTIGGELVTTGRLEQPASKRTTIRN
jgi:hypothetical protein